MQGNQNRERREKGKPRLLVTGGSGYLGAWVVRLASAGWDVVATYLTHPRATPGVIWHRLDVREAAAVATLLDEVGPAVVVHLAAVNPGWRGSFADNVTGTRHVARAAAAHHARLVHISSDVVFDGERGNYVETDPPAPLNPYGRSKARAEEEVRRAGGEAVIVRTSLIYGWRPRIDRHIAWVIEGLRGGKPVRLFTDEIRCPIWVESLAAAVVELAGLEYVGVLHVAGSQPLSRYEFGTRLLRFYGLNPGPVIPTSSRDSGLVRPLDCTLDCSRARALLHTELPGVDEVLKRQPSPALGRAINGS